MHESSNSRLFKSFENERSNTGKLSESVSFLWTGVAGTKANSGAASERTTDGGRRPESWLEGDRKKEVETNEIFKVAMWCFFFGGGDFCICLFAFSVCPYASDSSRFDQIRPIFDLISMCMSKEF